MSDFFHFLHKQNQIVQHNPKLGVIASSSDLALQSVQTQSAGNYTCIASNVEGDGESNTLELKVMCTYHFIWPLNAIANTNAVTGNDDGGLLSCDSELAATITETEFRQLEPTHHCVIWTLLILSACCNLFIALSIWSNFFD